jgi:mannosidase alpha-like ER degradation enhancer 2
MHRGRFGPPHSRYVSSLQGFWPGLQVLAGHTRHARDTFAALERIARTHGAMPDIFDLQTESFLSHSHGYPLRPELVSECECSLSKLHLGKCFASLLVQVESAYHLYTATGDNYYLEFARDALFMLQNKTRTRCGYAAIADVRTGRLDDRMDSYFLAETVMYLFLIFDEVQFRDLDLD